MLLQEMNQWQSGPRWSSTTANLLSIKSFSSPILLYFYISHRGSFMKCPILLGISLNTMKNRRNTDLAWSGFYRKWNTFWSCRPNQKVSYIKRFYFCSTISPKAEERVARFQGNSYYISKEIDTKLAKEKKMFWHVEKAQAFFIILVGNFKCPYY